MISFGEIGGAIGGVIGEIDGERCKVLTLSRLVYHKWGYLLLSSSVTPYITEYWTGL